MAEVRVGKPDVKIDRMAHTRGIFEGNAEGDYERMEGHLPDGRSTSRRSTGVNAEAQNPIDPKMPNLSPP